MNLTWTESERHFRDEVREFVQTHLPTSISDKSLKHQRLSKEDYLTWHRILADQGWGAPNWPIEYGGTGWNTLQRLIFEIESFKAGAPRLLPFGLTMLGPVLMKYGNQAQKDYFLPRMIRVEDWWCQGYSEPGAGSDLASLKTRAVKHGDHYIVNGQKTWTTLGQYADWIFCLVRTNTEVKPQQGISVLLIDMRSPGVSVHPIKTLDGGQDVNEVWLENVHVPITHLVGEENQGWTYAKYLLGHERTGIAGLGHCHRELKLLIHMAKSIQHQGQRLIDEARIRDKITLIKKDVMALEMLLLRVASGGESPQGPAASILKIRGSEIQQELASLQMELTGYQAWAYDPTWMCSEHFPPDYPFANTSSAPYFDMRKASIYGGTTEVQKNIIAKVMLSRQSH